MASTQIIGGIGGQYDLVFDATLDYIIQFTYNGNQVVKNQLVVRDNFSNEIVFDDTVVSMAKKHLIPANTLVNGKTYNMTIQVYYLNDEGEETPDTISDTILAKCYTTPVLEFTNLPLVVRNAAYTFTLTYTQAEDDIIDTYQISMYDSGNNLLYALDMVYPAPSTVEYEFSVNINDLFDGQKYSIRCVATSVAGMRVDTGLRGFAVEYLRPQNYSIFYVENAPKVCSVQIMSNVKIIDGFTDNGEPPTYIDGDRADLRDGNAVHWSDMIDVSGDFQLLARIQDFNPYTDIVKVSNGQNTITLRAMYGLLYGETSQKAYLQLYVSNGFFNYYIISNLIDVPAPEDSLLISLVRRGFLYVVTIKKEG